MTAKRNMIEEGLNKHRKSVGDVNARKKGAVEQARTATPEEAQEARKTLHALAEKVKATGVKAAGSAYLAIIDAAACAYAGFQAQQAMRHADDIASGKPIFTTKAKAAEKDAEADAAEEVVE